MRKTRGAAVVAILSTIVIAGCGDDDAPRPVELKTSDTSQFKGMLNEQMKNANIKTKAPGESQKK